MKIAIDTLNGNYSDKNTKIDTGINVIKKGDI